MSIYTGVARLVFCGSVVLVGTTQAAEQTFYTIITPDGPMQVEMPVPSNRVKPPAPTSPPPAAPVQNSTPITVPEPLPVPQAAVPVVVTPVIPAPVLPSPSIAVPSATIAPAAAATPATASPFIEFGGQQYVDSAYLEKREFNLEGKKRFYSVPDGLGGNQVIERESGVRLSNFIPQLERPTAVSLSDGYRRIAPTTLVELTNRQCLSAAQLKTAKPMTEKPVDFWPVPSFQPKFEFVLAELTQEFRNIHLMSYTSTTRRPSYYWPLPIFLDQRGCILEGVAGFYQSKTAATWLQQAALQGHLAVPKGARYLLLTPLVEAAELSGETLADRGQLRLTPLRLATP